MGSDSSAPYRPKHSVRLVTAGSLFDGHDAAINIMRRILQASGAEVIHLGHNRSVQEIVRCAIHEDVHGVAVTSYQGGHVEYFKYLHDLLRQHGCRAKIFGGGGGTILPTEIKALHGYGIDRIFSPDDGRALGLQGMINVVLEACDFDIASATDSDDVAAETTVESRLKRLRDGDTQALARAITWAENASLEKKTLLEEVSCGPDDSCAVLGVTGTGGAGKSSLVDELVRRFRAHHPDRRVAILSIDPSRRKSGGALLGDRIRMNAIDDDRVYMRSLATRQAHLALSEHVPLAIDLCRAAGFDLVIVETSGIGQSDTEIVDLVDHSLYVMTADYGAATQLEKIDMLDFADVVAINKFDKAGSLDALRDVRKQMARNRQAFDQSLESLPVFGTVASEFGDSGADALCHHIAKLMRWIEDDGSEPNAPTGAAPESRNPVDSSRMIPPGRARYLAEVAETVEAHHAFAREQSEIARVLYQLRGARAALGNDKQADDGQINDKQAKDEQAKDEQADVVAFLDAEYKTRWRSLDPRCQRLIEGWPKLRARYAAETFAFQVRDRTIEQQLSETSLSGLHVPKVCLPRYHDWGDILRWQLLENVPGEFPFTAGVFPLKREQEDPTRMFAGEGGPERTNRRFHYVSRGRPAKRLSTAFDSVTLYGEDPDRRPDIYGKIGNSGVSVASLDDAKKLYSGFDLADPKTSVSMTINGPAPMLLGYFLNAAIDQQCERYIRAQGLVAEVEEAIRDRYRGDAPRYQGEQPSEHDGLGLLLLGISGDDVLPSETYQKIKADTLKTVRGTVQADILKEDQAQNTCIFSTEFALRMMGDVQHYFIDHQVKNFYSVSVSGYHIAEAGANPITQLAFTLANGFTFVEYYLARGMHIDDFAPNFSFFFSNGMDAEYSVMGRVARRIWATAIRDRYRGNARSQKLKYHIQTSGRSLHAQEIAFNDIRTTLQALYAIYDNCNSLHTNAYDEAITTPTPESVRRALAIQLIINRELGLAKNQNPLQGSFVVEELTRLVEEAVLLEFRRLSDRGGVLGAMERMYQRTKIQEESLHYESLKHSGALPLVGVNMFLGPEGSEASPPRDISRSTDAEKEFAVHSRDHVQQHHKARAEAALAELKRTAIRKDNVFAALMETTKHATLGQITHALYEVGGQYRRNM